VVLNEQAAINVACLVGKTVASMRLVYCALRCESMIFSIFGREANPISCPTSHEIACGPTHVRKEVGALLSHKKAQAVALRANDFFEAARNHFV